MNLDDLRATAAGSRTTVPKTEFIVELCRGKRVLDVGCIDHSWTTALELGDQWLHHRIREVATETVGLDILEDDAAMLNDLGYNILVADAEDFDLGREFDVIVVGDLIEHLSNPGRFLLCARRHLGRDSRLVITTPNAFNVEQLWLGLRRNKVSVNAEHVAWYDPRTLGVLLDRTGFEILQFEWVETRFHFVDGPWAARAINAITRRRPILRRDFGVVVTPRHHTD